MQQTQELEINNNNSQVNESQLEDRQRGSSLLQEKRDDEMQNEVDHGKIEIDSSSNSEAATTVIASTRAQNSSKPMRCKPLRPSPVLPPPETK